jgi:hypothetical protein
MKKITFILGFVLIVTSLNAQKYITRSGYINFFSSTPIEDIKADNYSVSSALDAATGDLVFKVTITDFEFEKKLMQEHFNENYMESDKFPSATFSGKITNIDAIDFSTNGRYKANVKGDMTIHGVTKNIETQGEFTVSGEKVFGKSEFIILPADYDIEIPRLVRNKIAKEILVKVEMKYDKQE